MIKFEDLIDGLVSDGSKKGMNEVQSASAKQKAMQHLEMAKEIASGAGLDLVSLAEECMEAKGDAMEGASFDDEEDMMPKKRIMAYDEEESDEESEDDEEEMPPMKNAKAHAMILMLKKQKKA